MEVIQWTTLWEFFKSEYENEGGALGAKAPEDLKLRIIEHVCIAQFGRCLVSFFALYFSTEYEFLLPLEYLGCVQVLLEDYPQENC